MEFRYYITPADYDIAKINGIGVRTFYNRVMMLGWTIERASTECKHHQFTKNISNTMIKTLKQNGISIEAFRNRVQGYKWDIEKALNTPLLTKIECGTLGAAKRKKITNEQYQAAELNGIARCTLKQRILRSHWDIDKAINTPTLTRRGCSKMSYSDKL
jgi:hypothetical protein